MSGVFFLLFCRKLAGIIPEMVQKPWKKMGFYEFFNFLPGFEPGFGTSFELDESPI
jgi:hypothetical protein